MKMVKAIKDFVTDDQLLEALILFETRKMDAAKFLSYCMFDKWRVSTLEAVKLLEGIKKEIDN